MTRKKGEPRERRPDLFRLPKRDRRCNWCLSEDAKLTWAQVPPRACGSAQFTLINRIFGKAIKTPPPTTKARNGAAYATLCARCNERLGEFDDALVDFARATVDYVSRAASPRDSFQIEVRAGAVVRSVLGHLLAAKLESDNVPLDGWIRAYLDGASLDERLRLYFWFYPYNMIVVARDFVFRDLVSWRNMDDTASVLKFLPWAFLATGATTELPYETLHQFAATPAAETVVIEPNFEMSSPPFWPERPDRRHIITGDGAFYDAMCNIEGHFWKRSAIAPGNGEVDESRPDATFDE
jgi:hypothetical protein